MKRRQRWGQPRPHYLAAHAETRVRFHEVDSLHVVWHGHYLTYFEDGRNAFGREFGFGYQDILDAGFIAPLVHVELDFFKPARFDQLIAIETRMHVDPGARIQFTYNITGDGVKLATGRTVQVFTDRDGTLVLTQPEFFAAFLGGWAAEIREDR